MPAEPERPSWPERSWLAWWLAGLALFLLVGLREGTKDYWIYVRYFQDLADEAGWIAAASAFRDPGWGALNYLVACVWDDPRALFLVVAAMSVGTTLYCYRRMAPYFFVAVLGYVTWLFPKDLGQMRNGLCSTLVLFGLLKLFERRHVIWPATMGLAASVHVLGLVGLAAPAFRRLGGSVLLVVSLVVGVAAALFGGIGNWSAELVASTAEYWSMGEVASRIRDYTGDTPWAREKALEPYRLFGGSMSLTLLVAGVVLVWRRQLEDVSRYNALLIPVAVYGCVLFLLFRDFPTLAFRIRDTLVEPVEPILWSSLIAATLPRWRPWLFVGVVGYCAAWYFSGLIANDYHYGFALFGGG